MNSVSYAKQTKVYFGKISRIAIREKVWKFILFAAVIATIVAAVTGENMFETFEQTKSGFFTLASACIWLGIFNSIQSICKEHDIIRSEYRQGMNLSSYITANVMWQAVLCLVQTVLMFLICLIFGFFERCPMDGVFLPALMEYFVTMYLLTFGSAVLGIMVSSISGNPTTAMTIMPFVLIIQLIMSGVLFELKGVADVFANVTYSKWGMSAFGATGNINILDSKIVTEIKDNPMIVEVLQDCFEPVDAYDNEWYNVLGSWLACIGISLVCTVVSILGLHIKNRDS
ncbi:MAG: ABC transporter permease [Clostridia bacterium]|nr:ABC transporter permease [Clostridia bacterium]